MPARIVFTEEQIEYIKKRYLETLSTPKLAKELSCSHQTILGLVKKLGLPTHSGPRPMYPMECGGKKRCRMCHELKPICEFKVDSRVNRPRTYCIKCHNKRSQENKLYRDYGITKVQYSVILQNQQGVCAICHKTETHKHRSGIVCQLAVDHDHVTGTIRGLLCYKCNIAIGFLNDDPNLAQSVAQYLIQGKSDGT